MSQKFDSGQLFDTVEPNHYLILCISDLQLTPVSAIVHTSHISNSQVYSAQKFSAQGVKILYCFVFMKLESSEQPSSNPFTFLSELPSDDDRC
jgi:hypothetical protein